MSQKQPQQQNRGQMQPPPKLDVGINRGKGHRRRSTGSLPLAQAFGQGPLGTPHGSSSVGGGRGKGKGSEGGVGGGEGGGENARSLTPEPVISAAWDETASATMLSRGVSSDAVVGYSPGQGAEGGPGIVASGGGGQGGEGEGDGAGAKGGGFFNRRNRSRRAGADRDGVGPARRDGAPGTGEMKRVSSPTRTSKDGAVAGARRGDGGQEPSTAGAAAAAGAMALAGTGDAHHLRSSSRGEDAGGGGDIADGAARRTIAAALDTPATSSRPVDLASKREAGGERSSRERSLAGTAATKVDAAAAAAAGGTGHDNQEKEGPSAVDDGGVKLRLDGEGGDGGDAGEPEVGRGASGDPAEELVEEVAVDAGDLTFYYSSAQASIRRDDTVARRAAAAARKARSVMPKNSDFCFVLVFVHYSARSFLLLAASLLINSSSAGIYVYIYSMEMFLTIGSARNVSPRGLRYCTFLDDPVSVVETLGRVHFFHNPLRPPTPFIRPPMDCYCMLGGRWHSLRYALAAQPDNGRAFAVPPHRLPIPDHQRAVVARVRGRRRPGHPHCRRRGRPGSRDGAGGAGGNRSDGASGSGSGRDWRGNSGTEMGPIGWSPRKSREQRCG